MSLLHPPPRPVFFVIPSELRFMIMHLSDNVMSIKTSQKQTLTKVRIPEVMERQVGVTAVTCCVTTVANKNKSFCVVLVPHMLTFEHNNGHYERTETNTNV